jgi:pimeloyl-ACP methyl ester carboxylesterase
MPKAYVNKIYLEYDTFGESSSEPVLLISGLGAQMIRWYDEFCVKLANEGFFVIRFDNRDVGLSKKFDKIGKPDLIGAVIAMSKGEKIVSPYTLDDMAMDAVGILDVLKIEKAHIIGASMGGMIAQLVAINHPERVLTLTSIMSTTGNPELPPPNKEILIDFLKPLPDDFDDMIDQKLEGRRKLNGKIFPFDDKAERKDLIKTYRRSSYSDGISRQIMAILAATDRRKALSQLEIPSLIIHGTGDLLIPVEGGLDTADSIPNSERLIIKGMGHNIPKILWRRMIKAFKRNTVRSKKLLKKGEKSLEKIPRLAQSA